MGPSPSHTDLSWENCWLDDRAPTDNSPERGPGQRSLPPGVGEAGSASRTGLQQGVSGRRPSFLLHALKRGRNEHRSALCWTPLPSENFTR